MTQPIVSIRNISKRFGAINALKNISIDIQPGEIFALLGPSGCGKSTLLRVISGFEMPSEGELLLDGKDMTRQPPNKRPINMVFQSYAVFPHMSVADNVAYGLKMERVAAEEIKERVQLVLDQVHLGDYGNRLPDQLSGGQRQRVALARALVKKPRVLLLDEPLSALDAKLRDAMRLELVKLQASVGVTFVIVTHDQSEAMAMADRVAVLESGRLRQLDTPQQMYHRPCDAFVADFIGNIHFFKISSIVISDNALEVSADGLDTLTFSGPAPAWLQAAATDGKLIVAEDAPNAPVLAVRPENIQVSMQQDQANGVVVEGKLGDVAFQGNHSVIEITRQGKPSLSASVANTNSAATHKGDTQASVWAYWAAEDMLLLPHDAQTS